MIKPVCNIAKSPVIISKTNFLFDFVVGMYSIRNKTFSNLGFLSSKH